MYRHSCKRQYLILVFFTAHVPARLEATIPQLQATVLNNSICSAHVPAQLQATVPNNHIRSAHVQAQLQATVPNTHICSAHVQAQLQATVPNNHICSAHVPAQLQATVPNTHIFYITYLIIIFHLVQYLYSIYVTTVDTDTSDRPNAPYFS